MADITHDGETDRYIESLVKAQTTRAGKQTAWHAGISGRYPSPALYLISDPAAGGPGVGGLKVEIALPLAGPWQRAGTVLSLPAQDASGTSPAAFESTDFTSVEIRSGTAAMTIALSVVSFIDDEDPPAIPSGAFTSRIGPININMPDFPLGTGESESGGSTGGIPNVIINLAASVAPTAYPDGDFTSGTSGLETYPSGEWASAVRKGSMLAENNSWDIGPGKWDWTFVANPATSISGNQFHQRVGLGDITAENTATIEIHAKYPNGASKPAGADSEVSSYPAVGIGCLMGWEHRQIADHPNAPVQLKNVDTFWMGWKTLDDTGHTCKGHLAHDMRIGSSSSKTSSEPGSSYPTAAAVITAEFMIVRKTYHGYGATPAGRPASAYRGTQTIDGRSWYIYNQRGATTMSNGQRAMLLCFVPIDTLPNAIDIAPIINFCITTRYNQLPNGAGEYFERGKSGSDFLLSPDSWWHQDFLGFENDATHPATAPEAHIVLTSRFCRINQD